LDDLMDETSIGLDWWNGLTDDERYALIEKYRSGHNARWKFNPLGGDILGMYKLEHGIEIYSNPPPPTYGL